MEEEKDEENPLELPTNDRINLVSTGGNNSQT